jgi:hypothetical protein
MGMVVLVLGVMGDKEGRPDGEGVLAGQPGGVLLRAWVVADVKKLLA